MANSCKTELPKLKPIPCYAVLDESSHLAVKKEPATCSIYLKTVVNLLSWLQLVPFRIEWSGRINHDWLGIATTKVGPYRIYRKRRLWLVPNLIIQGGSLFIGSWNAFKLIKEQGVAVQILSYIDFFGQFGITWLTFQTFWFRQNEFIEIVNDLSQYIFMRPSRFWKLKVHFICGCAVLVNLILGFTSVHQINVIMSISSYVTSLLEDIGSPLFIQVLQYSVYSWVYLSLKMALMFQYTVAIVITFTLYHVAIEFELMIMSVIAVDQVMCHLENLKKFNDKLNHFCGHICALLFLLSITSHAVTPAYLLHAKSPEELYKYWYKFITITVHMITWIFACEYYRRVQASLRKWIRGRKLNIHDSLTQMDWSKLNLLAIEIENDPVGISCNQFTVSYNLLTSVSSILIYMLLKTAKLHEVKKT